MSESLFKKYAISDYIYKCALKYEIIPTIYNQ